MFQGNDGEKRESRLTCQKRQSPVCTRPNQIEKKEGARDLHR